MNNTAMNRLASFLCALLIVCGLSVAAETTQQPNLIVILEDDLGYGDLGCYGVLDLATPHIDRMAEEGMKFTSFYVSPVCSPTRASLMTGCIAQRVGIGGVLFPRNNHGLNPEEKTLPELLKEQGYATAIIGKWHLGNQATFHPLKHGFDSWYGTPASNSQGFEPTLQQYAEDCVWREEYTRESIVKMPEAKCPLIRDNSIIEVPADQTQFTQRYTREAVRFITEHRDHPFFLYLAHNMVHIPVHASADFVGKSKLGIYGDAIQELDWSTGEILKTLKELGLDENTLVIFTSDNGPHLGQGASAGPLRGAKGSTFEGGVRVPFIARWPGNIPAGHVTDEPIAVMDLLPTLVTLAGGTAPSDRIIDGKNIWPVLAGENGAKSPHEAIYYLRGRSVNGVRMGDWKYLNVPARDVQPKIEIELSPEEQKLPRRQRNELVKERTRAAQAKRGDVEMLFNLREDVGEEKNMIDQHTDIAARMKSRLNMFASEFKKTLRPAATAE
ncbi:Arylsulfatase [Stieleria maiorica]|uniref:Arylsulfatase n=1 Tax=Stieleria maiorica TaxID=2795974 RepID=A0A5B9MLX7_9BACT|nr:sulfatase [Stieleria maiorica]QEG02402.1 Arylsulfatase [Stieleria maiorica]